MIREMLNLECSDGHKHFAPNPNYWVGRACETSIKPADGSVSKKKCRRKLNLMGRKRAS